MVDLFEGLGVVGEEVRICADVLITADNSAFLRSLASLHRTIFMYLFGLR